MIFTENEQTHMQANDQAMLYSAGRPILTQDSKFNQGYTLASPVSSSGQVVAVRNGPGQVELFTQGSNGSIWNFYPDPNSDTGYTGVQLGLSGSTFAAGDDFNGNIVVFSSNGLQLNYIIETPGGASRWSAPAAVPLPQIANQTSIGSIFLKNIGGQLFVGVLIGYVGSPGPSYVLTYSIWNSQAPVFNSTQISYQNFNSIHCAWIGNSTSTAAVVNWKYGGNQQIAFLAWKLNDPNFTTYLFHNGFTIMDACTVLDANGNEQFFAALSDGNVYRMVANGGKYDWQAISTGMNITRITAALDVENELYVFGIGTNNRLYNWIANTQSPTGFSSAAPIAAGVVSMSLANNNFGNLDLFTIGTGANELTHLFLEELSMNWASQRVEVPAYGVLEQYISYSTDIQASDVTGVPLINSPVTVYASEESRLNINGRVYFVDMDKPAQVTTNAAGIISISQQTNSLAIPVLEFNYSAVMSSADHISIDPSEKVQGKLQTVNGTGLMNATDQQGNYILAPNYRTTTNTNSLAAAFNSTMQAVGTPSNTVAYPNMRHGERPGVWLREGSAPAAPRPMNGQPSTPHWRLSFDGDNVHYEALTADAVQELLAAKAQLPAANVFFEWLSNIGDFIMGVVSAVINVVDVVFTAIQGAFNAAITFIIDGVTYLFNALIDLVEQALDLVETIFAQVKVAFEKVWEWVGFLFSWPDILRSQKAIAYSINQYLGFISGGAAGIQRMINQKFAGFKTYIGTPFDNAINGLVGTQSMGGYDKANQQTSPEFEIATTGNIVLQGISNNPGNLPASIAISFAADDPISGVLQQLTQLASNAEASAAFTQSQNFFNNLGSSPSAIFTNTIAGLLSAIKGIMLSVVDAVQAVVDSLLQLGQSLVQSFQSTLNEVWNIPIISQLYSSITNGGQLTTINLISLLIAIPGTFAYKLLYNAVPFPDDTSVTSFQQSFNSQSMLVAAGLATAHPSEAMRAMDGLWPAKLVKIFSIFGAVATVIGGIVTAINDSIPDNAPAGLSIAVFVTESFTQFCIFPMWSENYNPNGNNPSLMLWMVTSFGALMDLVFIFKLKSLPETTNLLGLGAQTIYAIAHMVVAIATCATLAALDIAINILLVIPELCKLLRVPGNYRPVRCYIMAGIDVLFYTTCGILAIVKVKTGDKELNMEATPLLAI